MKTNVRCTRIRAVSGGAGKEFIFENERKFVDQNPGSTPDFVKMSLVSHDDEEIVAITIGGVYGVTLGDAFQPAEIGESEVDLDSTPLTTEEGDQEVAAADKPVNNPPKRRAKKK